MNPMSHNKRRDDVFFLCILMLLTVTATASTEQDIDCLKSVKESLEDSHGYLSSSWNFSSNTPGFVCKFNGVECWTDDENKVISLNLSNMGLKGQFPLGIGNCFNLQGLDLSNNELHGSIPLFQLPFIVTLDLSFNSFSGIIPLSIFSFTYINVLKLNDNYLTGRIPQQMGMLQRLKEFSVANNLLSGQIPNFLDANFPKEAYEGNNGLCGSPLEKCTTRTFAGGFAAGYAVSAFIVMVVYASYFIPWLNVDKNNKITVAAMILLVIRRKINKTQAHQPVNLSTVEIPFDKQILKLEEMGSTVKRLPYADIMSATDNFSNDTVIGMGKTGTMYKSTLHGHLFAVKKLHNSSSFRERFISELRILGSLRHNNLISLVGFCTKSMDRLLVYKYMPKGSLYDWLHPNNTEGEVKVMEWPIRVKVAIGLARGLAWLHQGNHIRLIHLDFCSKCVLLDHDFEPKISNFGNAMLTGIRIPSINPVNNESVFEMDFMKEDVLSFGIVLLELIMRIDASKMTDSLDGSQDEWIKQLLSESSGCYDMIDISVIGQGFDAEIYEFLKLAFECVGSIPEQRPTMVQVYQRIKPIAEKYKLVDDSELLMQPETVAATLAVKTGEIEILEA